jgi:hypothetical protein
MVLEAKVEGNLRVTVWVSRLTEPYLARQFTNFLAGSISPCAIDSGADVESTELSRNSVVDFEIENPHWAGYAASTETSAKRCPRLLTHLGQRRLLTIEV